MRAWEGPYTVTKAINDVVYRIQLTPRSKPKVVHHNRLWEYTGDNKPNWFKNSKSPGPATTTPTTANDLLQTELSLTISNQQLNSNHEDNPNTTAERDIDFNSTVQPRRSSRPRRPIQHYQAAAANLLGQES